jgi:hypothetical protein
MRNHFEARFILGALLASLSAAPAVLAQTPSQTSAQDSSQSAGSAKTRGQNDASASSSAPTQPKTQNASGNEPQMQSQEAPPQESLGEAARRARAFRATACQWSAMGIDLAIHPTRRTLKIQSANRALVARQRQTRQARSPAILTKRCGVKERERFMTKWRKSTSASARFRKRFRNMAR